MALIPCGFKQNSFESSLQSFELPLFSVSPLVEKCVVFFSNFLLEIGTYLHIAQIIMYFTKHAHTTVIRHMVEL
jgi:hypothetical protein